MKAKGCGLDDIQSNVQDFNNALTLDYSENNIARVEDATFAPFLRNGILQTIDLSSNPLTNVPGSLFKLAYVSVYL